MPELPEVETMCRGIAEIVGRRVLAAELPRCDRRRIALTPTIGRFDRRVVGRSISQVARLGKRLLIHLDDDQRIVIEPRMTGLVLLAAPPTLDHLRFRLRLSGRPRRELLFWDRRGLGTVRLMRSAEAARLLGPGRIGPDALRITATELRTSLGGGRRAIKVALLDQRRVAGIGNIYAAEILHLAGVDPRVRCDRLSGPQWQRIHAATGHVLGEAIRYEGSTLADGTYRNALNQTGTYQKMHRVYDRQGERCGRCRCGVIRRIVQVGRSTYFCSVCQRRAGRHAAVVIG